MNQKSASSLRFAFDDNVPGSDYFISPIMNSKERDEPLDPLIFGLWKVSCEIAEEVVYNAIREGYRRFDSATDYGNEVAVGKGIQRAINEGAVKGPICLSLQSYGIHIIIQCMLKKPWTEI